MKTPTQSELPANEGLGEPQVDFNDVFSLRKPRDARAGFASGLKSIAKGVLGGAAGLVAAPFVGAQREGVTGFAKGLAQGVVGAVVLPVTGVGVGTVQMVRGVINTPEAVMQASNGKLWDEDRREWVDKDMIVPLKAPQNKAGGRGQERGGFSRPESGDDYYAILQVPRDATSEQIKKQYYMLARKYHPDKNPGDAGAHERFQKLGEAYQVLGYEELRKRYDANGAEGLDVNFMEGGSFFNMLFGSDLFEHLVGELFIATAARCGGEVGSTEMAREQGIRVQQLCVNLKAILKRYEMGEEAFVAAMREDAAKLVKASFGETMLHTIGKVYDMQADIAAGGFFGGMAAKFRQQGESVRSQFQAASAAIKVYQAQQKIEAWQREQERKAAVATAAGTDGAKPMDGAAAPAAAPEAAGAPAGAEAGAEAGAAAPTGSDATATKADAAGADSKASSGAAATDGAAGAANGAAGATPQPSQPPPSQGPTIEQLIERKKLEEAALPLMLEAMWAANVLDIQNTLKKVCKFVLGEEGVPKQKLMQRATALKILGGIFMEAKAPESATQADARKQMEEAMLRVVEKRAQKEAGDAAPDVDD